MTCPFQTYRDGRLMVCTLPADHTDPAKNTPEQREHVLWAAKREDDR